MRRSMEVKQLGVKQSSRRRAAAPAPKTAVSLGILPKLFGYQLRLAQQAIFADFSESVAGQDISPGLFGILVLIDANPGLRQQRLAEAARLDRSSVVAVIDKLEQRALVRRQAVDRRSNALYLTAAGSALLRSLKPKVLRHEQRVIENLSPSEQRQLTRLLSRILPEKR